VLDLGPILASYTEKRGFPPYDPRLMVRLLIYGYTTGVRSSRAIERKCTDGVAFRYLAADQAPDFRSISRLRRRHLDALAGLFLQSLHLAQKLGDTPEPQDSPRRSADQPGQRPLQAGPRADTTRPPALAGTQQATTDLTATTTSRLLVTGTRS
jgi:hypothetical protein